MGKRITQEEFLNRFYEIYPTSDIEIIEYTSMSKPCTIKCNKCQTIYSKKTADYFLLSFNCCDANQGKTRFQKLKDVYKNYPDYEIIKILDDKQDRVLIKHLPCGEIYSKKIRSAIVRPEFCKKCTPGYYSRLSFEEVQQRVNEKFNGDIEVIKYTTIKDKTTFRCTRCGEIFETQLWTLLDKTRGCPKCDKSKYKGENFIRELLLKHNIIFKTQVQVPELPKQRFDFGIYDENNNLLYFIELQGDQHFKQSSYFRDSLEKIQERDNKKREYCKKNNIPLYEIVYISGKMKNLEILPFLGSTTISTESNSQANGE